MKKLLSIVSVFVIASMTLAGCGQKEVVAPESEPEVAVNDMKQLTVDVSLLYGDVLNKTDGMVEMAEVLDFESFNIYMDNLIAEWKLIDRMSSELWGVADDIVEQEKDEVSFHIFESVFAYYDKKEITRIFDAAPAGKKIKTLAEQLGVSAKRAYQILKMSQEELKAEAWDEAGDKLETLENGARAVKDVCKVTYYVAGAVVSGGATTVLGQAAFYVSGADLLLEIGDDFAKIALGYDNNVTIIVDNMRTVTKPASTFLAFSNILSSTGKPVEILDACVFTSDQIVGIAYDKEVMGINIDTIQQTVQTLAIPIEDKEEWLKEMDFPTLPVDKELMETLSMLSEDIIMQEEVLVEEHEQAESDAESEEEVEESEEEPILKEPEVQPDEGVNDGDIADSLTGTEWHVQGMPNQNLYISFGADTVTLLIRQSADAPGTNVGFYSYGYQNYQGQTSDGLISFSIQNGVLHLYDNMVGSLIYTATRVK